MTCIFSSRFPSTSGWKTILILILSIRTETGWLGYIEEEKWGCLVVLKAQRFYEDRRTGSK
jgi:hypothetical protein